ncbi:Leucine-rich repeat-containing protein 23 [Quaeritorhiza haematococci]|nr:Leucine-rich repeat-containing protein 23 [Quaeritorhiza haematococci]
MSAEEEEQIIDGDGAAADGANHPDDATNNDTIETNNTENIEEVQDLPGRSALDEDNLTQPSLETEISEDGARAELQKSGPPSRKNSEPALVSKTLTSEMVTEGVSLLARTGNGLSYAYTRLELHGKGITDLLLLEQYPHLRYLDLSDNALRDINALAALEYLLSLDLSKNQLKSIPAALEKRKYLQQANFSKNQIETIEVSSWHMCSWLNLNENKLQELKLSEFVGLVHVEARSNQLSHTGGINATRLRQLYLGQNKITKIADLDEKHHLQILHLRDNLLESLDGLRDLKSLSYLNLRNNRISKLEEVDRLKTLPSLKILILMDNPVDTVPNYRFEVLMRLPNLERLDKEPVTADEREQVEQYKLDKEKQPDDDGVENKND